MYLDPISKFQVPGLKSLESQVVELSVELAADFHCFKWRVKSGYANSMVPANQLICVFDINGVRSEAPNATRGGVPKI